MSQKLIEAYPLQWPVGWKRTQWKQHAKFQATFGRARDQLLKEVSLMGGKQVVLSTNVALRQDGLPYAGMAQPKDPGVAIYFKRNGKAVTLACDRWNKVEDNIRALSLTVEAMRGLSRWGASDVLERVFTGFTALPPPPEANAWNWRTVLEFPALTTPTLSMVRERRNDLARKYHPDIGTEPDHHRSTEINRAFEEATKELS